ncbi:MAG: helix-turn-helix transcriptional regulator [Erysipelotrichaceae bacterium]|nr:helix-turn-helix transcriptional regulator [Erysipelotrichaceae bacterium]
MFPNLEAEMARKKITRCQLAEKLNITPTTLGNKLNGKVGISLPECIVIRNSLGISMTIDELFKTEDSD